MLDYPLWKRGFLWGITLFLAALALPSLFSAAGVKWPDQLPNPTVNLGLDIAGGSHILLEADPAEVAAKRIENLEESVRDALDDADPRIRFGEMSTRDQTLTFMVDSAADVDRAREELLPIINGTGLVREWDLQVIDETRFVLSPTSDGLDNAVELVIPGWAATVRPDGDLLLEKREAGRSSERSDEVADPILLEVFNNLYMHIAEQMGVILEKTAHSVNIKERLDFSCAVFDPDGGLVANAPHMPVHLGSMGESVRSVIDRFGEAMSPGDSYVLNAPYGGGTHLPDVTVVSPFFAGDADDRPLFYVASRAHHADIGGVTPGSMPPASRSIEEEGVLIDARPLVSGGEIHEREIRELLGSGPYPARDPDRNMADLRAQLAANARGLAELQRMLDQYGAGTVRAYMRHVQENAEEAVRRAIGRLHGGEFCYELDGGEQIRVAIAVDHAARAARIDFSGTSQQSETNFNAPLAVCRAAVLYVFRTLVDHDIPMNEGCLRPLELIVPEGCLLNPRPPAAVVAGNVETSQCVVDALYGALGELAASQGTMNNLTFGNERYQYYETICGGAGAGPGFPGASAVHTHMTNSRLTDPEVLEWRYPVILRGFRIREGSGGRGRFDGGDGAVRELEFREAMAAGILSNHRRVPPFGLAGGEHGECGRNRLVRADGETLDLGPTASADVGPGDVLVIETPGGGGFGEPERRDAQRRGGSTDES